MCRFTAAGMIRVTVARGRRPALPPLPGGRDGAERVEHFCAKAGSPAAARAAATVGSGNCTSPVGAADAMGFGAFGFAAPQRLPARFGCRAGSYFATPSATSRCNNSPNSIAGLMCDSQCRSCSTPLRHWPSITALISHRSLPSARRRSRGRASSGSRCAIISFTCRVDLPRARAISSRFTLSVSPPSSAILTTAPTAPTLPAAVGAASPAPPDCRPPTASRSTPDGSAPACSSPPAPSAQADSAAAPLPGVPPVSPPAPTPRMTIFWRPRQLAAAAPRH